MQNPEGQIHAIPHSLTFTIYDLPLCTFLFPSQVLAWSGSTDPAFAVSAHWINSVEHSDK